MPQANRNRMRAASLLKLVVATLATSATATRLPGPFSNRNMRIRPSFKNLATLWATCSLGGLIFTWRAYRAANAPESPLDAVIVPGGGLDERGEPWPWVKARLDAALRHDATTRQYLVLSRGTTHKPAPTDADGFAVDESVASARYLIARGVDPQRIVQDTWSVDTIGNVAFARLMHADLAGWRRMHVVTSDNHLARTRAIFEWVFALPPRAGAAPELSFEGVADAGYTGDQLASRRQKEERALEQLKATAAAVRDLSQLHAFLFREHKAYAAAAAEGGAASERARGDLAGTY